jgi:DNA-binding transcriptional ArsR family regulator
VSAEPAPLDETLDEALDHTLTALADPLRRRAVELLGRRPHRAGELADALSVAPSVMSKHLRVLRQSGLVSEAHPDFDARVRIYTLETAPMVGLRAWLDLAERAWAEQLSAFRDHLDQARDNLHRDRLDQAR